MNIIGMKTYPHYCHLPYHLRRNLNLLRTYVLEGFDDYLDTPSTVVDGNDLEFLSLDLLVEWVKDTLPEYDKDFLEAASLLHKEYYDLKLFDYFAINEEDLFHELLYIKDEYELKLCKEK